MPRTLLIFFMVLSWTLSGQIERFINEQTNSYLEIYSHKNKTSIYLIVKADSCLIKKAEFPSEARNLYIDSLRKSSWTNWAGTKDVTNDFQVKIMLDASEQVPERSDSTYKFYYHFEITDRNGNLYSAKGFNWTTRMAAVEKVIKNQEVGIRVDSIKKTSIFRLTLFSPVILNSNMTPGNYASPVLRSFYF